MRRHRWEIRAVPVDLDEDDERVDTFRLIARAVNGKPDRFMFRRSADRAVNFYDRAIPGLSFYVIPITARQEPQGDLRR